MSLWNPHFFETLMLICFGCSWPFAIAKTIRSKTVEGKSITFIVLIFIGYVSGITYKLTGDVDGVIWLYMTNGSLVFTEIVLYFRYNRSDVQRLIRAFIERWRPPDAVDERYGLDGNTIQSL